MVTTVANNLVAVRPEEAAHTQRTMCTRTLNLVMPMLKPVSAFQPSQCSHNQNFARQFTRAGRKANDLLPVGTIVSEVYAGSTKVE